MGVRFVCVFMCLCVHAPAWENRLNLIYSPRGHLLTESNPLTGPRLDGSLTRLLLYIAAVMGTSLEIPVLLICALLSRFEQKCLTFCTQPFHWETPDALQLQRINQSTCSQHFQHLSTCCLPGQWFLRGLGLGLQSLTLCYMHGCPPPPAVRAITGWIAISLLSLLCINAGSKSNCATDCSSPARR